MKVIKISNDTHEILKRYKSGLHISFDKLIDMLIHRNARYNRLLDSIVEEVKNGK